MKTIVLSAVGLLLAGVPVLAHHAFGGEFDPNKPVLLKGPVTKVEWVNPHAWIHIEVTDPDGTKKEWMVEGGTPNTLLRRGITRESLKVGTVLVIDGYQARDHSLNRANGRNDGGMSAASMTPSRSAATSTTRRRTASGRITR